MRPRDLVTTLATNLNISHPEAHCLLSRAAEALDFAEHGEPDEDRIQPDEEDNWLLNQAGLFHEYDNP